MSQLTLFDEIVRRCRQSDPDTSRLGAEHAQRVSSLLQKRMLEAFRDGPKTANEAALWCVQKWSHEEKTYDRESYRKRKLELFRAGAIRFAGRGVCGYSGHLAERFEAI